MRAEAIILSGKGYPIKQISQIKDTCVITVSRWIDQWEERGIDGILEGEGRGSKGILTEDERREVGTWLNGGIAASERRSARRPNPGSLRQKGKQGHGEAYFEGGRQGLEAGALRLVG
jgi:transposase